MAVEDVQAMLLSKEFKNQQNMIEIVPVANVVDKPRRDSKNYGNRRTWNEKNSYVNYGNLLSNI